MPCEIKASRFGCAGLKGDMNVALVGCFPQVGISSIQLRISVDMALDVVQGEWT